MNFIQAFFLDKSKIEQIPKNSLITPQSNQQYDNVNLEAVL